MAEREADGLSGDTRGISLEDVCAAASVLRAGRVVHDVALTGSVHRLAPQPLARCCRMDLVGSTRQISQQCVLVVPFATGVQPRCTPIIYLPHLSGNATLLLVTSHLISRSSPGPFSIIFPVLSLPIRSRSHFNPFVLDQKFPSSSQSSRPPSIASNMAFVPQTSTLRSLSYSHTLGTTNLPQFRQPAPFPAPLMRVAPPTTKEATLQSTTLALVNITTPPLSPPPLSPIPTRVPASSTSSSADSLASVRQLISDRDYPAARAAFTHLAATVEDAEVLRTWAFLEADQGNQQLARQLFTRAIRAATTPEVEAAAWNAWALSEQWKGNITTARKCFLNGLRVDPSHAPLCQAFAIFEAKFGLKRRARELFARGAELNRGSHRTWMAWATFEAAEDNLVKARFLFRTALTNTEGEDGVSALLAWAKAEEKYKQWTKARELYREGLQKYGKQCKKLLHAWGTLESHTGNHDLSRQLFAATLDCPGMNGTKVAPTYQAWALAERKAGNIAEARRLFRKGADANPNHVYIWQAWGIMEQRCRNYGAARDYFRKGVQVNPKSAPTWSAWARMEAELGRIEEARRLYQRATQADCSHARSLQAWAVLEGKQNNLLGARDLFKRAVAANPSCAPAWQAWGCMEEGAGNVEAARDLFQKGVDADPTHIAVWQAWANMEIKLGEWKHGPACSLPDASSH